MKNGSKCLESCQNRMIMSDDVVRMRMDTACPHESCTKLDLNCQNYNKKQGKTRSGQSQTHHLLLVSGKGTVSFSKQVSDLTWRVGSG